MEKNKILDNARQVFDTEIKALEIVRDSLNGDFSTILDLIVNCKGKVIITGMGKPGHIGSKIAATMASLGTPSFFLHPAEALHGDLGMIQRDDVIIAISYSGESTEVTNLISNIKIIGAKLIALSGNEDSTLVKYSDYSFVYPKFEEACEMKLAPTSSTTTTLVLGDAFAVCASKMYGFSEKNYALLHPAGSLGKKLLLKVSDIMQTENSNAVVTLETSLHDAIVEMSSKALGIINVVDDSNALMGVFTDGDLRRVLANRMDVYNINIETVMAKNPKFVIPDMLAVSALQIMNERNISALPVIEKNILIGTVRINDVLKEGIVI